LSRRCHQHGGSPIFSGYIPGNVEILLVVHDYKCGCTREVPYLENHVKGVRREATTNLLEKYENNRDKYLTFESFFPEFVDFLNEYAGKTAR